MSTFWYILCPGEMAHTGPKTIAFDAHDLARHYKVPMARCLVQRNNVPVAEKFDHLPRLYPDPTGKWIRPQNPRYKGKSS